MSSSNLTQKLSFVFVYGENKDSADPLKDLSLSDDIKKSFIYWPPSWSGNTLGSDTTVNLTNTIVVVLPGAKFEAIGQTFTADLGQDSLASGIIFLGGASYKDCSLTCADWLSNIDKRTFNPGVNSFLNGESEAGKLKFAVPNAESDFLDASAATQNTLDRSLLVKSDASFGLKLNYGYDSGLTNWVDREKRITLSDCTFNNLGSSVENLDIPALTFVGMNTISAHVSGNTVNQSKADGVRLIDCSGLNLHALKVKDAANVFVDLRNVSSPAFHDLTLDVDVSGATNGLIKADPVSINPMFKLSPIYSAPADFGNEVNGIHLMGTISADASTTLLDLSSTTIMPLLCVGRDKLLTIKEDSTLTLPSALVVSGDISANGVSFKPVDTSVNNIMYPPCLIVVGRSDFHLPIFNTYLFAGDGNANNINLVDCDFSRLGSTNVASLTCLGINLFDLDASQQFFFDNNKINNSLGVGLKMKGGDVPIGRLQMLDCAKDSSFIETVNHTGVFSKLVFEKTKIHNGALIDGDDWVDCSSSFSAGVELQGLYDYEPNGSNGSNVDAEGFFKFATDTSLSNVTFPQIYVTDADLCIKQSVYLRNNLTIRDDGELSVIGTKANPIIVDGSGIIISEARSMGVDEVDIFDALNINDGYSVIMNYCKFVGSSGLRLVETGRDDYCIRNLTFQDTMRSPALSLVGGRQAEALDVDECIDIINLRMIDCSGKSIDAEGAVHGKIVNAYFQKRANSKELIAIKNPELCSLAFTLDSTELIDAMDFSLSEMPIAPNLAGIMVGGVYYNSGDEVPAPLISFGAAVSGIFVPPLICVTKGHTFDIKQDISLSSGLIVGSNGKLIVRKANEQILYISPGSYVRPHGPVGIISLGDRNSTLHKMHDISLSTESGSVNLYYGNYCNPDTKVDMYNCELSNLGDASLASLNLVHSRDNNKLESITIKGAKGKGLSIFGGNVNMKDIYIENSGDEPVNTNMGHSGKITNLYVTTPANKTYSLLRCDSDTSANKTTTRFVVDVSDSTGVINNKDGIFVTGAYTTSTKVFDFDETRSSIRTPVIYAFNNLDLGPDYTANTSVVLPATLVVGGLATLTAKNVTVKPQTTHRGRTSSEAPPAIVILNEGVDAEYDLFDSQQLSGLTYGIYNPTQWPFVHDISGMSLDGLGDASGCVSALTLVNLMASLVSQEWVRSELDNYNQAFTNRDTGQLIRVSTERVNVYPNGQPIINYEFTNITINNSKYRGLTMNNCSNGTLSNTTIQKPNDEFIYITGLSNNSKFKGLTLDLSTGGHNKSLIGHELGPESVTQFPEFMATNGTTREINLKGEYTGSALAHRKMFNLGESIRYPRVGVTDILTISCEQLELSSSLLVQGYDHTLKIVNTKITAAPNLNYVDVICFDSNIDISNCIMEGLGSGTNVSLTLHAANCNIDTLKINASKGIGIRCDGDAGGASSNIKNLSICDAAGTYLDGTINGGTFIMTNTEFIMTKTTNYKLIETRKTSGSGTINFECGRFGSLTDGILFEGRYEDISLNDKKKLMEMHQAPPAIHVRAGKKLVVKNCEMLLPSNLVVDVSGSLVASNCVFTQLDTTYTVDGVQINGGGTGGGGTGKNFLYNVILNQMKLDLNNVSVNELEAERITVHKSWRDGLLIRGGDVCLNDILIFDPTKNGIVFDATNAHVEGVTISMRDSPQPGKWLSLRDLSMGNCPKINYGSFYRQLDLSTDPILVGYDASGTLSRDGGLKAIDLSTGVICPQILVNGVDISGVVDLSNNLALLTSFNKGETTNGTTFNSGGGAYLDVNSSTVSDDTKEQLTGLTT